MTTIAWLHLSDLHFTENQYNHYEAAIVLKSLFEDVTNFLKKEKFQLDFIVLTGDIAFAGKTEEYEIARSFFDHLLKVTNISKDRFFIIPGNHDVDKSLITSGAKAIGESLRDNDSVLGLFKTVEDRRLIFQRLDNYASFLNNYFKDHLSFGDENIFYTKILNTDDKRIAILGLNSAWLCNGEGERDRNSILVGKTQVINVLDQSKNVDIKIALVHHPFDWLKEFDRKYVERTLKRACDFILHGHLHEEEIIFESRPVGKTTIIPAGACYMGSEYPNSYNFVVFDIESRTGTTYLRRFSPRLQKWIKDIEATGDERNGQFLFDFSIRDELVVPYLGVHEYKEIITAFQLEDHLNDNISVGDFEQNAWEYYKERLFELEEALSRSFNMSTPIINIFQSLEEIFYNGALRTFKPLLDFITLHNPHKNVPLNKKEIDKAILAFIRLVLDKYLKELYGFYNFMMSLKRSG